jgi:drug/metabolite transporter (DMT)-like permease
MPATKAIAADNVKLGIAVIIGTDLALSLGDAAIKLLSASFVLWQIFILRSLIAIPVLVAIIRLRGKGELRLPRQPGWTALRSLLLTLMWVAFYAGLTHLALGIAAAVYYTLPIFITLFAALFIGDRIDLQGWGAIFLGFVGVLLVLNPDASSFNAYALLPLLSAILYALAMILTRTKCREEHPLILSLSLNCAFVLVGTVATLILAVAGPMGDGSPAATFLFGAWSAMGSTEWLSMALLSVATIIGSIGAAIAYQVAPPATVATFDFSYVALASLWGILIFGERPGAIAVAGMVMIVVAGILAVRRKA